jgi:hypothetical protein
MTEEVESDEDAVKKRLEALEFRVERIPEDLKISRPDLRATKDAEVYYFEVKTRELDEELRSKMESVGIGKTESMTVSLDKQNWLSGDIKKAGNQLKSAAGPTDFRVLWYRADSSPFVQDAREQLGATLMGIRMVFGKRNGEKRIRPCVYAGYADYWRYKDIDGSIVEVDGLLNLIPNEFSPRREAFSRSALFGILREAAVDIQRLEKNDLCCIVEPNVDRKDDAAVLASLRTKYPGHEFLAFGPSVAGTTVTTIDGSGSGA